MIDLGMYKAGSNPELDQAVRVVPEIQKYFTQDMNQPSTLEEVRNKLDSIVSK